MIKKSTLPTIKTINVKEKLYYSGEALSQHKNKEKDKEKRTKVALQGAKPVPTAGVPPTERQLRNEVSKWKARAERYHKDKLFLLDQLAKQNLIVLKNIRLASLLSGLGSFLKNPVSMAILLCFNAFFLAYLVAHQWHYQSSLAPYGYWSEGEQIRPFTIQTGSFASLEQARLQVKDLQGKGFKALISQPYRSKSGIFRVYVGTFPTVRSAEGVLKSLMKQKGYEKSYIRKRF